MQLFSISTPYLRQWKRLCFIFQKMQVKKQYFFVLIAFSFVIAALSGVSLGLLFPLAEAIVGNEIHAIYDRPMLGNFLRIIEHANNAKTLSDQMIVLWIILLIFACQFFKQILIYCMLVYNSYHVSLYNTTLSNEILFQYLRFGKRYFDQISHGSIQLMFHYIQELLSLLFAFQTALTAFFKIAVYGLVMLTTSWKLTLISSAIIPPLFFCTKIIIARISNYSKEHTSLRKHLNRELFNALQSVPFIRFYGKTNDIKKRYASINKNIRANRFKATRLQVLVTPLQQMGILLILLIIFLAIIFFLLEEDITQMTSFVIILYIAQQLIPQFSNLAHSRAVAADASSPSLEIEKLFQDTDKYIVPTGNKHFEGLQNAISIQSLSFQYQEGIKVLQNVSLDIKKGSMTALVGPTGSGKSTLAQLILRMYDCSAESIFLDNTDIREFTAESLYAQMEYVSQDPFLFHDSIRMNLTFGLTTIPNDDELLQILEKAQLHTLIKRLPKGFDTSIGDKGIKLSGGEKQRLALARVLLKNKPILFLDEATSALDSKTEQRVQNAVDEVTNDRTTIIIAHRLSTIQNADYIAYFEHGTVVEQGTLESLLEKKGKFYAQWKLQKF